MIFLGRPALHLWRTAAHDTNQLSPTPPGFVDDASRMNQTEVQEVRRVPVDIDDAEQQLVALLVRAVEEQWKVSIAGARHSMGGHTIYPGGIAIDMLPLNRMSLDASSNILHVQAGALWKDVIAYLDDHGRSVAVMQSNNSFSIGGSISVNCHGWQYGRPPIASTVRSFRLLKADGTIVRCSREQHAELFSLVLGGYGLFGIILEVDLEVVPNRRYRIRRSVLPAGPGLRNFDDHVRPHPGTAMVFARMNVSDARFLQDMILCVITDEPAPDGTIPPLSDRGHANLRRHIFRGSVASDYGKRLRWTMEAKVHPEVAGSVTSRNQLLNEGVEVFQNRSDDSTDILHEAFLPHATVAAFVDRLRTIIPAHGGDLLNLTVRSVEEDGDTFLRYADQPMLSLVMLFNHARTPAADQAMEAMTREIIDAALDAGGRFYLPYRLHATPEQFVRAYPRAPEFFQLKRKYDPLEVFQNRFYLKYARVAAPPTGSGHHVGQKTH